MKTLIYPFILSVILFSYGAMAQTTLHCSHPELCKMAQNILMENNISDVKTEVIVNMSGDPHEYEPKASEIKGLISAPILITGPHELNPWLKKILEQRSLIKEAVTITLPLTPAEFKFYKNASAEALSHFWLYPKVYCILKIKLNNELKNIKIPITKKSQCDIITSEKVLKNALAKVKMPIILTHDAILPLLNQLKQNDEQKFVSIKGSGHHEELSASSLKNMYDALKSPRVIWIKEKGINIPANIFNKIRTTDKIIEIDSAQSLLHSPFSVLLELAGKLEEIKE